MTHKSLRPATPRQKGDPGIRLPRLVRKFALLLAVLAIAFLIWEAAQIPWTNIQSYMPRSPGGAALALLGLYGIKTIVVVMPLYALYLTASLMFPPVWAIVISYAGLMLELYLGYVLGQRMGRHQVLNRISQYRFSNWLIRMTERHPALSCFVIRYLPLPADVSNMLMGAFSIRRIDYYIFSLAGFTPKLLSMILAGEAAAQERTGQLTYIVGLFLLLEFSPLLILWFKSRRQK